MANLTMFSGLSARFIVPAFARRSFGVSAAAAEGHQFRGKTFKEAWLGDSGAYPVMSVIVFSFVFSSSTMLYMLATSPDARISKKSRKSLFRGELKDEYY